MQLNVLSSQNTVVTLLLWIACDTLFTGDEKRNHYIACLIYHYRRGLPRSVKNGTRNDVKMSLDTCVLLLDTHLYFFLYFNAAVIIFFKTPSSISESFFIYMQALEDSCLPNFLSSSSLFSNSAGR